MNPPVEVRDSWNAEKYLLAQRKPVHFLIFSEYIQYYLPAIYIYRFYFSLPEWRENRLKVMIGPFKSLGHLKTSYSLLERRHFKSILCFFLGKLNTYKGTFFLGIFELYIVIAYVFQAVSKLNICWESKGGGVEGVEGWTMEWKVTVD